MRVVLDSTSEVGRRAGHVLLGEADLEFVGLWDAPDASTRDRSGPVSDVAGFDVVVSDREDRIDELLARCSVEGVPLVLWPDAPNLHEGPAASPVAKGANVGSALSEALRYHPSAGTNSDDSVIVGWTEPGKPKPSEIALPFPDPVGMAWANERAPNRLVAFRDDEWGGATVTIEGAHGRRIVGVADLSSHLEALALAAAGLVAAEGAYGDRVQMASQAGEQLMNKLLQLELDVAVWRSQS